MSPDADVNIGPSGFDLRQLIARRVRRRPRAGRLLGLLAVTVVLAAPSEAAFAFRKPLVVRGARIVGGPHADFPVLVSIVDPNLRTTAFGGSVRSLSGHDIEFRANDLVTLLDHEIERYDPSTGTLVAWVRLPSITNGTNVTIHLYYGDPGITCARNNPERVWDSGYRMVQHLEETAGPHLDSTANGNDSVAIDVAAQGSGAGRIDGADQFSAASADNVDVGDSASLDLTPADSLTAEAWVRTASSAFQFVVNKKQDPVIRDWQLHVDGSGFAAFWMADGALPADRLQANSATVVNDDAWHYLVGRWDRATGLGDVFVDGVSVGSATHAYGDLSNASPLVIGEEGDSDRGFNFDGLIDEVRVSNLVRSDDWIATTFRSHRCPSLSVFPAGCVAGDHFVDDSGAQAAAGLPLFNDATAGSGLDAGGTKDGGLAWQDWNGDGCLDLVVNTNDAVVASRLYLQDKSSTCTGVFTDVTSCIAAGLLATALERSVIWGDLDNDGRPDFMRNDNLVLEVYLNNGPGSTTGAGCPAAGVAWSRFGNPATGNPSQVIDDTVIPGLNAEGLGLLDYDADGDLDLVADNATGGFLMLQNDGAGVLTPVGGTGLPGASAVNGDYLAVGDFDVDGDVDLFSRRNDGATVWVNVGGSFALNLNSPEVGVNANKGGVAMCDLDNDGDLDFVWTDGLNGIAASAGAEAWRNNGEGGTAATWTNFPLTFVPAPSGGENVDGVSCGDVDNDGDLDLAFTSGANDYLFRNDGGFAFTDVTPAAFGATDGAGNAFGDYDRDGDLDLVLDQAAANERWRNETGGNNYLMVRALHDVDGAGAGTTTRDAIGATVSLRSCSGTLLTGVREVNGGGGMGSQSPPLVHFGLPTAGSPRGPNMVYVVRVQFVGGTVRQKAVVPAALGCYQQVTITDTDADDLSACVATAVELQSFEARGCDGAVDLRWTTASEIDNLGFHLHRAERPEGPFDRITPSLIPGLGSSPTGSSYRYVDAPLPNGTAVHYELEDIDTGGHGTRHGPVTATPQAGDACEGEPGDSGGDGEGGSSAGVSRRYGEPGEPRLSVLESRPDHVVLELVTPGFDAILDGDGRVRLAVPEFEDPADPGAPAVPFRRAVVAALAGKKVRLGSVQTSEVASFDGFRLTAVGAPEIEVLEGGVVRAGRRRIGSRSSEGRGGFYPRSLARLVRSFFQGETKKAEVALHPLRYDERSGRVQLNGRLVVRLDFAGGEPRERSLGGARGRQPAPGVGGKARGVVAQLVAREEGLYRVAFEDVFGAGGRGVPVSKMRLSRRGEAVAYHVEPPRALFAPGQSLFFLGGGPPNPYGDAVYELELGASGLLMDEVDGAPSGGVVEEVLAERVFEENRFYQAGLLEAPDLWLWDLVVSPGSKSFPFSLGGLAGGSWRWGRVTVRVMGASDLDSELDHHVRVLVNGLPVAEASWSGKTERVIEGELPPGVLQSGENTLTVENVADTGAAYSMVFLNRFTVAYPRLLVAEGDELAFRADEPGTATVEALSGGALVLETTASPAWVRGAAPAPGGLKVRVEAGASYRLFGGASGVRRAEVRRPGRGLLARSNRADWLLLAPREMLAPAAPLVELRKGQGLRTKAVALEDVYEQFGHGETSPEAIHRFLAHAFSSWAPPSPRYVVLLGDSTYDPKDYLGTGVRDRLPSLLRRTSYLWTASDPSLVAVNGDDPVPDLAVGRLPARDVAEAASLVEKVVAFERGGHDLSGAAVLVADDPDAGGDFEADAEALAGGALAGRPIERVFVRELGGATRDAIRSALDAGPGLVSYMGHGGTAVWASENVWNVLDVPGLAPQARPPFLLTMNCLNGFFHFPAADALGEAFFKAEGRGAIAAFSPSGLSVNAAARSYQEAVLAELASGRHRRLGDAILAAQGAYSDGGALPELLAIYHLFGDPALKIR